MPLYDFQCQNCGTFERWVALAEINAAVCCPSCATVAKRLFSAPNINLGSGSLRLKVEQKEPQVLKKGIEPKPARHYSHRDGRPWMISH